MKLSHYSKRTFSLFFIGALAVNSQASITLVTTANVLASPNQVVTYEADPTERTGTEFDGVTNMGTFEGITMSMSADVTGTWFLSSPVFRATNPILAGETVKFTAAANMILSPNIDATTNTIEVRSAFSLRTDATGSYALMVTGGNDSLFNYYMNQPTPLAIGDTNYANTNASYFGGASGGAITAVPSLASPDSLTLNSTGSTFELTGGYGPANTATDFSYQNIMVSYTADANIPANTFFNFTFEGNNPTVQLSLIPEPSGALLGLLGLTSLGLVRNRKS